MGHINFGPVRASSRIPSQFEEWRKLIYRFDLVESVQLQGWIPAPEDLAANLIRTPRQLALLKWSDVNELAATSPAEQPVSPIWHAASIQSGGANPVGDISMISPAQLASSPMAND